MPVVTLSKPADNRSATLFSRPCRKTISLSRLGRSLIGLVPICLADDREPITRTIGSFRREQMHLLRRIRNQSFRESLSVQYFRSRKPAKIRRKVRLVAVGDNNNFNICHVSVHGLPNKANVRNIGETKDRKQPILDER